MNDDFSARRRQLLRNAGVGGAAVLAGCSEQLGLSQNDNNSTDGNTTGGDTSASVEGESKVGIVASVDQQALQQITVEVQQEMQSGNLTQAEAQQQYQQRRQELVDQAIESLTGSLGSSITVLQRYPQLGAVAVRGPPAALIEALELDAAQSLVLVSDIEAAAQSTQSTNSTNSS